MDFEMASRWISDARDAGIIDIFFTGGEPLLYFNEISKLVYKASRLKLGTNIITSAAWTTNRNRLEQNILNLASNGLKRISISCDEFHVEFVPIDRCVEVAEIAANSGLEVFVRTIVMPGQKAKEIQSAFMHIPGVTIEKSLIVAPFGRATSIPNVRFPEFPSPPRGPCYLAMIPEVSFDNVVYACCVAAAERKPIPGLTLGNAWEERLQDIIERRNENWLLNFITFWGPAKLHDLLLKSGQIRQEKNKRYLTRCQACIEIMSSPQLIRASEVLLGSRDIRRQLVANSIILLEKLYPEFERKLWDNIST